MKGHDSSSEYSDESNSDENEKEPTQVKGIVSRRGRKPIDERWTRVVKFKPDSNKEIPMYSYIKDSN